jgi:hypothetical protein
MNRQGLEQILRLRPAALTSPPELQHKLKDRAMNNQFANTLDLNGDMFEFGLIAAASPDFTDALIRALIAAGPDTPASTEPVSRLRSLSPTDSPAVFEHTL